jgi:hypothetical protein
MKLGRQIKTLHALMEAAKAKKSGDLQNIYQSKAYTGSGDSKYARNVYFEIA